MKRLLAYLRDYGMAYMTGSLVAGLILADIFSAVRWDARSRMPARGPPAPKIVRDDKPDIQNYVLFTTVDKNDFTVVTGTQFASSTDRRIAAQWCYLTRAIEGGAVMPRLNLATADASGAITPSTLYPMTLTQYGIDPAEVATLIETGCRFQKET